MTDCINKYNWYILGPNHVDTGRKFNVHKKFRRHPGRVLNVLCTFNLCSVSMENAGLQLRVTKLSYHGDFLRVA